MSIRGTGILGFDYSHLLKVKEFVILGLQILDYKIVIANLQITISAVRASSAYLRKME